ncbi:hypothetical protein BGX28_002365 [Mortierella sp. GBA30]|nr:hypothetical protein BGX28_002365 [Mortierella sp. GBA30]
MGGITLADSPPDDPEGSIALLNGLYNPNLLKDLALLNFASTAPSSNGLTPNATDIAGDAQTTPSGPSFCISDFLVPGLQTKVWEDWQDVDDLNDFTSSSGAYYGQDISSEFNALPFQFGMDGLIGNTPVWDNSAVPVDQAYDELVFDLSPSAFETPTVNVADLIVGPDSMAASAGSSSVSPLNLSMSSVSTYQDLALANLYGFSEPSTSFDSDSESEFDAEDSEEADEEESEDDQSGDMMKQAVIETATKPAVAESSVPATTAATMDAEVQIVASQDTRHSAISGTPAPVGKPEDPNKRRMEEALVARINNDLGPEHMAGLFEILKSAHGHGNDDEDEEMEVDLSCLDETVLVQVYQYVETCCMQTMGSILAQERERAAEREAAERRELPQFSMERTPELSSPGHNSGSSSSPSPRHPSSVPSSPSKGGRRRTAVGNKKRSPGHSPYPAPYHMEDDIEQDVLWTAGHPSKARRKRTSGSNSAVEVGGGYTGKGRRIQKDQYHYVLQPQQQKQDEDESRVYAAVEDVTLRTADDEVEAEFGDEDEIDVVGI